MEGTNGGYQWRVDGGGGVPDAQGEHETHNSDVNKYSPSTPITDSSTVSDLPVPHHPKYESLCIQVPFSVPCWQS